MAMLENASVGRASRLEALPLHIQEEVCEHLEGDPLYKHSVSALSRASRQLHSATSRVRYRSIRIRFSRFDIGSLTGCISLWKDRLQRRDCATFVRRITLTDCVYTGEESLWPPEAWPLDRESDPFPLSREGWPLDRNDEFWTLPEPIEFVPWENDMGNITEGIWRSLGHLISILPGLRDFYYQVTCQIGPQLLQALNRHPGRVRLHMDSFSLRSLYQIKHQLHDIDPDEYELATSPYLSSVRLPVPVYRIQFNDVSEHRLCFNENAILEMVRGLAPNLKSVSIYWTFGPLDDNEEAAELAQHERPAWPGPFFERPPGGGAAQHRRVTPGTKGTLESLSFGMGAPLNSDLVSQWYRYTDFSVLRSLNLRSLATRLSALETLTGIAEAGGFRSLRCLSMWMRNQWLAHEGEEDGLMDPELARLLRVLPPLESLELNGLFDDMAFEEVLRRHGASLRRLRLIPARDTWDTKTLILSAAHAERLVRACGDLEDLELLVPRTLGSSEETGVYRALSRLGRLDKLSLLLDCQTDPSTEARPDDQAQPAAGDRYTRNRRNAAIKAVIDEALATAIFNIICRHRAPRLVRLHPVEVGSIKDHGVERNALLTAKCLSWSCSRVRDDKEGRRVRSEIIGVRARDWNPPEVVVQFAMNKGFSSLVEDVWPESGGDLEKMKAFPLWEGDEDAAEM